jgi:hypothetical protein
MFACSLSALFVIKHGACCCHQTRFAGVAVSPQDWQQIIKLLQELATAPACRSNTAAAAHARKLDSLQAMDKFAA